MATREETDAQTTGHSSRPPPLRWTNTTLAATWADIGKTQANIKGTKMEAPPSDEGYDSLAATSLDTRPQQEQYFTDTRICKKTEYNFDRDFESPFAEPATQPVKEEPQLDATVSMDENDDLDEDSANPNSLLLDIASLGQERGDFDRRRATLFEIASRTEVRVVTGMPFSSARSWRLTQPPTVDVEEVNPCDQPSPSDAAVGYWEHRIPQTTRAVVLSSQPTPIIIDNLRSTVGSPIATEKWWKLCMILAGRIISYTGTSDLGALVDAMRQLSGAPHFVRLPYWPSTQTGNVVILGTGISTWADTMVGSGLVYLELIH